ncbi:hypothetical protein PIROE2DRAFT_64767, partial [Piromyces sp. E2]
MDEFNGKYKSLEKAFIAKFLGTNGDKELKKSLLLMQKRINADNAQKNQKQKERINDLVIREKNYDEAKLEVLKCFSSVLGGNFQSRMNELIRISEGGLQHIFGINKLQTFRTITASHTEVDEGKDRHELPIEISVDTFQWECPLFIDNEMDPMILITRDEDQGLKPVLSGFDKTITERMINCPLNALYIDEFTEKLKVFIDPSLSLKSYRASLHPSHPIQKSPFTRKKIIGAIPLGENDKHVNMANWSLMKIMTGGKNLGDIHLWFFVLYRLIKTGKIPFLKDVEPLVEAQVKYRFTHYTTSISLSNLSNFPQTKVFYPTAAWTCLITPFLIPQIPSNLNLFYIHLSHYQELLQIIDLFDIELPKNFQSFANRMEIFTHLLSYFKRNPKSLPMYKNGIQKASVFLQVAKDSDMSSGGVCGNLFIPIDGEIRDEDRMKCVQRLSNECYKAVQDGKITLDELAWLIDFVDVQKNLSDINIVPLIKGQPTTTDSTTSSTTTSTVNNFWKEWDDNVDKFNVTINAKTCRPFYYIREGVTWLDELGTILNTSGPMLSLDKHFGNFVDVYQRYPNRDEYILFLYRKICL